VARAKRTDRAEARRRYRAYLQTLAESEGALSEEEFAAGAKAAPKASRSAAAPVLRPGEKVGMFSALRLATRPVHYLDDLRFAPTLILKTNAIWPPALISLAGLAYGLTRTDYNDGSTQFLLSFVLLVPPLIQPMIAGFLAPRATWLAGIVAGAITGVCYEILYIWYFGAGHLANAPVTGPNPSPHITGDLIPGFTFYVLVTSVTFGALLGAGSGWYKRFLSLAAPASNARSQRSGSSKPASRRPAARR
jgi:hypothetical protein